MSYCKDLPPGVQYAVQAIAQDEDRTAFPWTNVGGAHQQWFRGNHSDIGGGWKDHRLADYTLQWMTGHAQRAGLDINLNNVWSQYQSLTFEFLEGKEP